MNIEQPKIYPGIQKDYEDFARILHEHGIDNDIAKECAFSVFFGWKLCPDFRIGEWDSDKNKFIPIKEDSLYSQRIRERNSNNDNDDKTTS